jgi:serine/threonine-protein kinase
MAPEQAGGAALSPRSDVFALGIILREILTGERGVATLPIQISPLRPIPIDLVAIAERAIAPSPAVRFADAKELAAAVASFIDGDRKRERATELFGDAQALMPKIAALREEAATVQREARAALDPLPPSADASLKRPGWALEDHARELAQQADLETFRMTALVDSALIEADLPEAHALLARHYRELHEVAERANDPAAVRLEVQLRTHDRGEHAPYLAGVGALSLTSDPPADVEIRRYEERGRRLVDELVRSVRTPIAALELPRGSYLLVLRAPGHHEVRYPVTIGRHEHWHPVRPGASATAAIVLPPVGTIGDDEVYVPGGHFLCGGDPQAAGEVLPRQHVWVDSFVMRRHPITNDELLDMANDLIDAGNEQLALSVVPRQRGTTALEAGPHVWPRDPATGHFQLGSDDEGLTWEPRAPAFMVSWHGAMTYAAWLAQRTGRPYRLPGELEVEKAARGVDGRAFPWGNAFDPSYACMRLSHEAVRPVSVDAFPVDESPYGVRGLAGNIVEWCLDEYHREGPSIVRGLYVPPSELTADVGAVDRTVRGGCFLFDSFLLRAATRHNTVSIVRDVTLGFRLVRSL